jgi:hypothetical protein
LVSGQERRDGRRRHFIAQTGKKVKRLDFAVERFAGQAILSSKKTSSLAARSGAAGG